MMTVRFGVERIKAILLIKPIGYINYCDTKSCQVEFDNFFVVITGNM